jgi:two-component system, cell cycle sensor histidine kinase and response regulator CckA
MSAFGILNLLAAFLELCVPSYAFRLVRRFGSNQVGSFVVIAFSSLALMHVLNPLKAGPNTNTALSLFYGGASILLLIGMGHTETICRQRQQAQDDEQKLRTKLEQDARDRAEDLNTIRQEMAHEIVRLQSQVETLASSDRQYRLLFAQNPQPMWIFDLRTGRILVGNLAALDLYGFSQQEFSGLAAKDLMTREASVAFLADSSKPCSSFEQRGVWRHRRKDRSPVDVEIMALDLRYGDCPARLILAQDVGPRLRNETEMCEAQRMRTLRQLTEGLAHHFGHILGVVEGQAALLQGGLENPLHAEHLKQVLVETKRGDKLIRTLRTAAGCDDFRPLSVDVNQFVREKEGLLRRLVGERIRVEFHPCESMALGFVDPRALEWILVNLVLNARDAIIESGSIGIHTEVVWVDARTSSRRSQPPEKPGHYVRMTVSDTGRGMSLEVQEQLFEPFFTTRSDGQALGLGLATILGAVKQHGGWLDWSTRQGQGTELRVFLPAAPAIDVEAPSSDAALPVPERETILLVEPNDRVRDLSRHILQKNGHRVIEADGPATAALLMEGQGKSVDVLLTDLKFPQGPGGAELAEQLRLFNPQLKVVYSSGPLSPDDTQPSVLTDAKILFKPYTPERLLRAINSCLGSSEKPRA